MVCAINLSHVFLGRAASHDRFARALFGFLELPNCRTPLACILRMAGKRCV
jgi:hypothetical protein